MSAIPEGFRAVFKPMQPPPSYGPDPFVHHNSEAARLVWEIFRVKPSVN